jgi:hypothetical protein
VLRFIAPALVGVGLCICTTGAYAWTSDDVQASIDDAGLRYGVSTSWLRRTVGCETGQTFEPSLVGDHGTSYGPAQIHRGGLLAHYLTIYSDVFDPYEAIPYMARAFAGEWVHLGIGSWSWSCA